MRGCGSGVQQFLQAACGLRQVVQDAAQELQPTFERRNFCSYLFGGKGVYCQDGLPEWPQDPGEPYRDYYKYNCQVLLDVHRLY